MAYLDFTAEALDLGSYPIAARLAPRQVAPRLNGSERAAVMLARKDGVASLNASGRVSKIFEFAFGFRSPNKLADVRLEALRRFAIAVAHERQRLIEWERNELRLLRFAESQIEEAASIAAQFRRAGLQGGWIYILFGLFLTGCFEAARSALGDAWLALTLITLAGLPVWAMIAPRHQHTPRKA